MHSGLGPSRYCCQRACDGIKVRSSPCKLDCCDLAGCEPPDFARDEIPMQQACNLSLPVKPGRIAVMVSGCDTSLSHSLFNVQRRRLQWIPLLQQGWKLDVYCLLEPCGDAKSLNGTRVQEGIALENQHTVRTRQLSYREALESSSLPGLSVMGCTWSSVPLNMPLSVDGLKAARACRHPHTNLHTLFAMTYKWQRLHERRVASGIRYDVVWRVRTTAISNGDLLKDIECATEAGRRGVPLYIVPNNHNGEDHPSDMEAILPERTGAAHRYESLINALLPFFDTTSSLDANATHPVLHPETNLHEWMRSAGFLYYKSRSMCLAWMRSKRVDEPC